MSEDQDFSIARGLTFKAIFPADTYNTTCKEPTDDDMETVSKPAVWKGLSDLRSAHWSLWTQFFAISNVFCELGSTVLNCDHLCSSGLKCASIGLNWVQLFSSRLKVGSYGLQLSSIRFKLGSTRPNWGQTGLNWAQLRLDWSQLGSTWLNWTQLSSTGPNRGSTGVKLGSTVLDWAQMGSNGLNWALLRSWGWTLRKASSWSASLCKRLKTYGHTDQI